MKRRRSNTACPMRKSNRTYKCQDRRRLFRTVRKFSPVEAPQVGTYHGAQDDLSIDPIKNPISIKKAKVTETPRIATFNCKGSNHISGREKIAHRMKTHNLYRYFILKKLTPTKILKKYTRTITLFSPLLSLISRERMQIKPRKKQTERRARESRMGESSWAIQLRCGKARHRWHSSNIRQTTKFFKTDVIQHDNRNITMCLYAAKVGL